MPNITDNINHILQRVTESARQAGRKGDDITVLAVSKQQPVDRIRQAWEDGLYRFGENYLQEALGKIETLSDLAIEWHFIGPIQSNKTAAIAEHFAWVHSVDRLKIARRLSEQRPPHLPPLNICLQVNIDREASKTGVAPDETAALAEAVATLPNLHLRGLMAIPRPRPPGDERREPFFRLARLLDNLRNRSPELSRLDTLSMGMSGDMEDAILAGATIIRVGTALFGPRPPLRATERTTDHQAR